MKIHILALIAPLFVLPSCVSNEEFAERMSDRTEAYQSFQNQRAEWIDTREDFY